MNVECVSEVTIGQRVDALLELGQALGVDTKLLPLSTLMTLAVINKADLAVNHEVFFNNLAESLLKGVEIDQITELSADIIKKNRKTLRRTLKKGDFPQKLQKYLSNVPMPAEMSVWHEQRMERLFNKVLQNPSLFHAVARIMAYKGKGDFYPRFIADLILVHKVAAHNLNTVRPLLVFSDSRIRTIGGNARKSINRRTDMQTPNWRHNFYNHINLRDSTGRRLSGEKVLERVLHELLHSKEDNMVERVMGVSNALLRPNQQRYFKQKGLDDWPLKKAAVIMALNTSILGRYTGVNDNFNEYYSQFRERHARWFATQTCQLLKTCISSYAPIHFAHQAPTKGLHILRNHIVDFLQNAPELLAKKNPFMPSVSDICEALPFEKYANKLAAEDMGKQSAPKTLEKLLVRLELSARFTLKPQDLRPVVPDNRTDWALSEILSFTQTARSQIGQIQRVQQDKPLEYKSISEYFAGVAGEQRRFMPWFQGGALAQDTHNQAPQNIRMVHKIVQSHTLK